MSIGHRLANDELLEASIAELYAALGERDTPKLYQQSYKLDTDHDIPCGGGNSVDRKTKYIDRILYQQAMDGSITNTAKNASQMATIRSITIFLVTAEPFAKSTKAY